MKSGYAKIYFDVVTVTSENRYPLVATSDWVRHAESAMVKGHVRINLCAHSAWADSINKQVIWVGVHGIRVICISP